MIRVLAVAALAALTTAAAAQDAKPQPTDADRLQTHPRFQIGCMIGRAGMMPPSIPRRFIDSEDVTGTFAQLAGYAICKATKDLPEKPTPEQAAEADRQASADIARFSVIVQEAVDRAKKRPKG